MQGPTLPSCGGYVAFFSINGCPVIELDVHETEDKSTHIRTPHADLDRLCLAIQQSIGKPRNFAGLQAVELKDHVHSQVCTL